MSSLDGTPCVMCRSTSTVETGPESRVTSRAVSEGAPARPTAVVSLGEVLCPDCGVLTVVVRYLGGDPS